MRQLLCTNNGYKFVYAMVFALVFASVALAAATTRAERKPMMMPAGSGAEPTSAYSEYTLGVYLMETGAVLRAVEHLENAWRLSGHDIEVGRQLSEAYLRLKNFTRCEMVADDMLEQRQDDYDALLLKAKVRYVKRDREAAVGLLERIREYHGLQFEIERLLGNIAYEAGNIEKALEAYGNCIKVDNSHAYIHYRYGTLLVQSLRFTEAEQSFLKAIELDPGFVEPALELADMYVDAGRPHDAVPVLENVVSVDPSNLEAVIALAQVLLQSGRFDEGIRLLEARRSPGPLPRDAEILLGRLYYEAGEYGEAFTVFEGILKNDKNNPELARILGEISLRAGDPERSLHFFDRAIEMDPSDYRSYVGKFFAASPNFNQDDKIIDLPLEERVELLDRASALVKGFDFEGNYLLGVSYLSLDSLRTARLHLLRANEIKENDRGTLLNLASVFEKAKEYERAETYLSQLHELDPDDPSVCNFYGYLLAQMKKDLDKAEKLILRALDVEPENGYYLDSLGWVYYQQGEYAKAVVELEKATLRVADDPVILEHLGDAYRALRRMDEARTAYERSSRLQDGNSEILEKIQSTDPDKN